MIATRTRSLNAARLKKIKQRTSVSSLSFKRFMRKLCNCDNDCERDRNHYIASLAGAHNPALGVPDLFQVSGKLPTYLSPNSTLSFASHLGQIFGLGKGCVGSFRET